VLKGHEPVPEPDLMAWGRWMEDAGRHVALSIQGDVNVSTVFLGLDHSFGHGPPVLFETMVFRGEMPSVSGTTIKLAARGELLERYSTWDEAAEGHRRWVAKVFKATPILPMPT
jgi:hypothetical protein